jgi:methylenetetrahydrofolate dehydrogenase (NADP+)/methenyltetrahydrofolate cyclohydrolase
MSSALISGKEIGQEIRDDLTERIIYLKNQGILGLSGYFSW